MGEVTSHATLNWKRETRRTDILAYIVPRELVQSQEDLSQLGHPIADTIILDGNSPASYIFHPINAVPVSSWSSFPVNWYVQSILYAPKSGLHQDTSLPRRTFLCPPHPSSLPPICARCRKSFFLFFSFLFFSFLFFSFLFFSFLLLFLVIRTCQLQHRHCRCLHLPSLSHRQYPIAAMSSLGGTPTTRCTCPHTGCRHTKAIPLPSPSPCLV